MPNVTTHKSLDDGETRVVRRTITLPVRNIKTGLAMRRSTQFLAQVSHISWRRNVAAQLSEHNVADRLSSGD